MLRLNIVIIKFRNSCQYGTQIKQEGQAEEREDQEGRDKDHAPAGQG
jgi:hypothetical protein